MSSTRATTRGSAPPSAAAAGRPQCVDVALRDGSTVRVRPVVAADQTALAAFLGALSSDSLYFRGCGYIDPERLSRWAAEIDPGDRFGLVVTTGTPDRIVGHASYVRVDDHRAEVAFEVADELHGNGIGTLLLGQLAGVAAQHGLDALVASVMASNRKMIDVFLNSGFVMSERNDANVIEVEFPTAISAEVLAAFDRRQHTASLGAVRSFLHPASVAIVGASRRPTSIGGALLRNLVEGDFAGGLYPVNPHADELLGVRCYHSLDELPEVPELAVVAVPAGAVLGVARDCAALGVRALLVISSGFSEVGGRGVERQRALLEICRNAGMRLIGPNCLGVLNTDPAVRLNATFVERVPGHGGVAMMSQSGGVAIALMDVATEQGIGVSSFVSVGNKADISGNDLLEYWEEDPDTGLIALYLESFGNPRRFVRITRRVGVAKPILAVKSGRTPAGSRAASSHTAALLSAADVTVDALFRQAGVVRADTLGELLDTASLMATQPPPQGARVAILTNGGGPGIMCADSSQAAGLDVAEAPRKLRARLARMLPEHAAVGNPVDMTAAAGPEHYGRAIAALAESGAYDAIITLFVPALGTDRGEVTAAIDAAARTAQLPVASVVMGAWPSAAADSARPAREQVAHESAGPEPEPAPPESAAADREPASGRPRGAHGAARFRLPEDAVRALAHAVEHARWRA
ncbi:MAG: GNAT family N-acetyltransferase, partial [Acidobacteriota bacterium]|nr:GNAT family N-acetyltransferase [Acidobacteriota bacterium]